MTITPSASATPPSTSLPERDDVHGPDQLVPGFGNTMRDGLGVRAQRGGVDTAIVGGLILDPILGVRYASIGVAGGRVVSVGRAGNPDTMDGVDVVLDVGTAVLDATGMIVTPGGVDPHVHWLSPQVTDALLAGGITTMVSQDYGPVWNLGTNPESGLATTWAALEDAPINAALFVRGSSSRAERVEDGLRAGGAALKIHEDVGRRAGADPHRAGRLRAPRRPARRSTPTGSTRCSRSRGRWTPSPAAPSTPSTSRAPAAATRPTSCASPAASGS